jgi:peptidoglycan/LPS O-acetylase OafA/YrhL
MYHPGLGGTKGRLLAIAGVCTATYNFLYITTALPSLTGPYWSLSLEEQFYILFPLFYVFVKNNKIQFFTLLIVLILLTPLDRNLAQPAWFFRIDPILIGILVAKYKSSKLNSITRSRFHMAGTWLALISLCLAPHYLAGYRLQITFIAVLSGYLVLIASYDANYLCPFPKFFDSIVNWFGTHAFPIYLSHALLFALIHDLMFITIGKEYPSNNHIDLICLVLFGILLYATSSLLHIYVEIPMIKIGRNKSNEILKKPFG